VSTSLPFLPIKADDVNNHGKSGAEARYLLVATASALSISWTTFHDPSASFAKDGDKPARLRDRLLARWIGGSEQVPRV
jgi:hypothetical protein